MKSKCIFFSNEESFDFQNMPYMCIKKLINKLEKKTILLDSTETEQKFIVNVINTRRYISHLHQHNVY